MPSIRRRAAAWVSDCPSADRLWSGIKAASGRNRTMGRAPHSRFPYHWNQYQGLIDSGRQTDPSLVGRRLSDGGHGPTTVGVRRRRRRVRARVAARPAAAMRLRRSDVLIGRTFLASEALDETRCLILDIAMPGMSGPDLQQELIRRRHQIPIVFITAHSDESVRPELLAQGAAECLFKPFSETALMDALNTALRMR